MNPLPLFASIMVIVQLAAMLLAGGCFQADSGVSPNEPALPAVGDSVIGDLRLPPEVSITSATQSSVAGTAENVHIGLHRIVLYAKTDRWYVQPLTTDPYTLIDSDGTWSNSTNSWNRLAAVLVEEDFVPEAVLTLHPSTEPGVLVWDEVPDSSARTVTFAGRSWHVKMADETRVGPGPNYFSGSENAVHVDGNGLHLRTEYRDGNWFSAEVFSVDPAEYGEYTFELNSRVDNLDYNLIFACFIYQGANQEIDFEFSQSLIPAPDNAQYVTQPWDYPGNIERYQLPAGINVSTHQLDWRADALTFTSWRGRIEDESPDSLLHNWTYTGPYIPLPDGERIHINLWFINGEAPVSNEPDEVVVSAFTYQP